MNKVLIIQTAFAGDLILTLPLIQETRRLLDCSDLHVLCIPDTQTLLDNHPAVSRVIVYDKKNGKPSLFALMRKLRRELYDICLSPHRSLRSALLARATMASLRVSFDRSAGRFLYTDCAPYLQDAHEVVRNLSLLRALGKEADSTTRPQLFPTEIDEHSALTVRRKASTERLHICLAPGSVWATKRWTEEGFIAIAKTLAESYNVIIIGGREDAGLADRIVAETKDPGCVSAAGALSFLGTAALLRDARLLISNDSAPVHMASAMGTPVVEIYGATIPEFGFTPVGVPYQIVQKNGLSCRPCGMHGGDRCPIISFECMRSLTPDEVLKAANFLLGETPR